MKIILPPILLIISILNVKAQELQSPDSLLSSLNVKKVSTVYYLFEDTINRTPQLLTQKIFRQDRQLENQYHFSFNQKITSDSQTVFKYDSNGNCIGEKNVIQHLKVGQSYLESDRVLIATTTHIYSYNDQNKLIKEARRYNNKLKILGQNQWVRVFDFHYKENRLIKEISSTTHPNLIGENFQKEFFYNSWGLNSKIIQTTYLPSGNTVMKTDFTYNNKRQLVEEKRKDTGTELNNTHYRYEYNSVGKRIKTWSYIEGKDKWMEGDAFDFSFPLDEEFDPSSQKINWIKHHTTYENGLIHQEIWKSEDGQKTLNFITTYEYFN